jgi:hypothetical protein
MYVQGFSFWPQVFKQKSDNQSKTYRHISTVRTEPPNLPSPNYGGSERAAVYAHPLGVQKASLWVS